MKLFIQIPCLNEAEFLPATLKELPRELPGIVDQVISMSLFAADEDNWRHDPERADIRRLVCRAGNPFGLPAKDRSGRLDITEAPDLGALLAKINAPQTANHRG